MVRGKCVLVGIYRKHDIVPGPSRAFGEPTDATEQIDNAHAVV